MSWNKQDIDNRTHFNQKYYERLKLKLHKYEEDLKRDKRTLEQLCKCCYYLRNDNVAGSAFTAYYCIICNSKEMHSNTNVGKLCSNCSHTYLLCQHCGGELD